MPGVDEYDRKRGGDRSGESLGRGNQRICVTNQYEGRSEQRMKPLVLLIALTFTSAGFGKVLTFSTSSGFYSNAFRLTISAKTPGGVIRFTTNCSIPTVESPICNGVLTISNTTVLRARVFQGTK